MNARPYSLAVVLAGGEPGRLYTGLSLLVSAAADGQRCAGLAAFGALEALCDPALRQRAMRPEATPELAPGGRETFGRSLDELRETARELDGLDLWACSASVDTMSVDLSGLDGVMSVPRFMQVTAGARLVAV